MADATLLATPSEELTGSGSAAATSSRSQFALSNRSQNIRLRVLGVAKIIIVFSSRNSLKSRAVPLGNYTKHSVFYQTREPRFINFIRQCGSFIYRNFVLI